MSSVLTRSETIDKFLADNEWPGAKRKMLAGDASFRKYERVHLGEKQAVLMDSPPDKEDIRPFVAIANQLHAYHLSAPNILAKDEYNGLLLLEDLGDNLYARVLENEPHLEQELYFAAADALIDLYNNAETNLHKNVPLFDMEKLLAQVSLLPEWFIPLVADKEYAQKIKAEYMEIWKKILLQISKLKPVLVLYDFHAENLIWLPERKNAARAGLLDFQDAMIGSPAYDMVSFLEDARRDVSAKVVTKTIEYYLEKTGIERESFMATYAILGAQRNCRIVGTFARLAVRDGKKRYLSFMPRMWKHIEHDISHPLLSPLKNWIDRNIKPEWHRKEFWDRIAL